MTPVYNYGGFAVYTAFDKHDVTHTQEEESRGKRDCDEDDDDSPSISQLAAQV